MSEDIATICNADSEAENGTFAVPAMPALQLGARREIFGSGHALSTALF